MEWIGSVILIGVGATAITDLWGIARKPLMGMPPPDYGLVGRWLGHMSHGRFRHDAIAKSPPVPGERLVGWTCHYLIGIAFAAMLVGWQGRAWLLNPTIVPALVLGLVTAAAPFLLMQPGMGAGMAASRTPRPGVARLHTLLTHAVFGLGLYIAGRALRLLSPL